MIEGFNLSPSISLKVITPSARALYDYEPKEDGSVYIHDFYREKINIDALKNKIIQ